MSKQKRFIEDSFPIKEVSEEGAKEKKVRRGNLAHLHIWWARRPLATSRATNYASLIPSAKNEMERQTTRNFISELADWYNSGDHLLFDKARKQILNANKGIPPKVLDPFGGGGSIPLEALRLGCDVYSNDYNPVAVFVQKCSLEYPAKYGKNISRKEYYKKRLWLNNEKTNVFNENDLVNPLVEDINSTLLD